MYKNDFNLKFNFIFEINIKILKIIFRLLVIKAEEVFV